MDSSFGLGVGDLQVEYLALDLGGSLKQSLAQVGQPGKLRRELLVLCLVALDAERSQRLLENFLVATKFCYPLGVSAVAAGARR